jgi:hypothetical protein
VTFQGAANYHYHYHYYHYYYHYCITRDAVVLFQGAAPRAKPDPLLFYPWFFICSLSLVDISRSCNRETEIVCDNCRLEIVDRVAIPADLPAGEWVLGWRWDCEQSTRACEKNSRRHSQFFLGCLFPCTYANRIICQDIVFKHKKENSNRGRCFLRRRGVGELQVSAFDIAQRSKRSSMGAHCDLDVCTCVRVCLCAFAATSPSRAGAQRKQGSGRAFAGRVVVGHHVGV